MKKRRMWASEDLRDWFTERGVMAHNEQGTVFVQGGHLTPACVFEVMTDQSFSSILSRARATKAPTFFVATDRINKMTRVRPGECMLDCYKHLAGEGSRSLMLLFPGDGLYETLAEQEVQLRKGKGTYRQLDYLDCSKYLRKLETIADLVRGRYCQYTQPENDALNLWRATLPAVDVKPSLLPW